jgi:ribosomal protein L29
MRWKRLAFPRPHAEAIAKGLSDFVEKELVTRDFLKSELAALRAEIRSELAALRAEFKSEIAVVNSELRDEFRREIGRLELQIRAL